MHDQSPCSRAKSTTRSKKSLSTTRVVGLCGNDDDQARGRGRDRTRLVEVLEELAVACRRARPEHDRARDDGRVDVDRIGGIGTSTASPGWRSASIRWASPSFEPMVAIASVSGSSSTPKRSLVQVGDRARSLGMPRQAE